MWFYFDSDLRLLLENEFYDGENSWYATYTQAFGSRLKVLHQVLSREIWQSGQDEHSCKNELREAKQLKLNAFHLL